MSERRWRILIVGSYGVFGGRIVELLAGEQQLELVVAGRSLAQAQAFCARLNAQAALRSERFDRAGDVTAQIRTLAPDIVVEPSGQARSRDAFIQEGHERSAAHSHVVAAPRIHVSWQGGKNRGGKQMLRVLNKIRAAVPLLALVVGATSPGAQAQGLVTTQKLSAALANELVGESVAECKKNGHAVVAVVVDLDGVRQAVLRGDGAPIHSTDNAFYKAYTSASLTLARKEDGTKTVAERMAKAPATTVPQFALPNVTYAVGGVAIKVGDVIIGGLGVSGAPGGQLDEDCAMAALAKIKDRMK
jgi:uncharacterized protein GlcG (DUF336 family)